MFNSSTKGIRSNRYLADRCGSWRNVAVLALLANLLAATSCVETAECDASVPCESGQICYDYECRAVCEVDDDCGAGTYCSPCARDDAEGASNHCFDAVAWACLPEGE